MSNTYLSREQILAILNETPLRLVSLTAGLTSDQLRTSTSFGEWSVNEVLAHLRACNDVWADCYIARILVEENPTIKTINPRRWINDSKYLEEEFKTSLKAFTKQRRKLLGVLEGLCDDDWTRTNTLIGAGKPLRQTLYSHADGLARHERAHVKQIGRIVKVIKY